MRPNVGDSGEILGDAKVSDIAGGGLRGTGAFFLSFAVERDLADRGRAPVEKPEGERDLGDTQTEDCLLGGVAKS